MAWFAGLKWHETDGVVSSPLHYPGRVGGDVAIDQCAVADGGRCRQFVAINLVYDAIYFGHVDFYERGDVAGDTKLLFEILATTEIGYDFQTC